MKRTQIVDLLTTIKATFVSFFSIAMFVALAVAIFLGIDWSGKALEAGAEKAFTAGNFHDLEILFPYGLTDSDLEALKAVEGVSQVEAGQVAFTSMAYDDAAYAMRVGAVSSNINKLDVVEGELPTTNNQIALEARWARRHEVSLGQKLTVSGTESEQKQLLSKEFTVTALVDCPAYLSNSANTWGPRPHRQAPSTFWRGFPVRALTPIPTRGARTLRCAPMRCVGTRRWTKRIPRAPRRSKHVWNSWERPVRWRVIVNW